MKIVLIGPPGAGKGTQAEKMALHWKIPRITTGDLFRQAVQNQTPLGKKIEGILEKGVLVSDDLVLELMQERMAKTDCKKGFVLDGFPRTEGQAKGLEAWLKKEGTKLDGVLALEVSEEEAVLRMSGRRQCSQCGFAYHVRFHPPRREGICDQCGFALVQRKDDQEATIRNRLKVYAKETAPLLQFYEARGLLQKVNGLKHPDAVFETICSLIR